MPRDSSLSVLIPTPTTEWARVLLDYKGLPDDSPPDELLLDAQDPEIAAIREQFGAASASPAALLNRINNTVLTPTVIVQGPSSPSPSSSPKGLSPWKTAERQGSETIPTALSASLRSPREMAEASGALASPGLGPSAGAAASTETRLPAAAAPSRPQSQSKLFKSSRRASANGARASGNSLPPQGDLTQPLQPRLDRPRTAASQSSRSRPPSQQGHKGRQRPGTAGLARPGSDATAAGLERPVTAPAATPEEAAMLRLIEDKWNTMLRNLNIEVSYLGLSVLAY